MRSRRKSGSNQKKSQRITVKEVKTARKLIEEMTYRLWERKPPRDPVMQHAYSKLEILLETSRRKSDRQERENIVKKIEKLRNVRLRDREKAKIFIKCIVKTLPITQTLASLVEIVSVAIIATEEITKKLNMDNDLGTVEYAQKKTIKCLKKHYSNFVANKYRYLLPNLGLLV